MEKPQGQRITLGLNHWATLPPFLCLTEPEEKVLPNGSCGPWRREAAHCGDSAQGSQGDNALASFPSLPPSLRPQAGASSDQAHLEAGGKAMCEYIGIGWPPGSQSSGV